MFRREKDNFTNVSQFMLGRKTKYKKHNFVIQTQLPRSNTSKLNDTVGLLLMSNYYPTLKAYDLTEYFIPLLERHVKRKIRLLGLQPLRSINQSADVTRSRVHVHL